MNDFTDRELLHDFARRGDEAAFAEVVRRYGGLVFGAALRRLDPVDLLDGVDLMDGVRRRANQGNDLTGRKPVSYLLVT